MPAFANTTKLYATYMFLNCGYINNRRVRYCDLEGDPTKIEGLSDKAWMLFVVAEKVETGLIRVLAERCLDQKVLYVCTAGVAAHAMDLEFDLVIVERQLIKRTSDLSKPDFSDTPMTIPYSDIDNGFWCAGFVAVHEEKVIEEIIVVNLTQNSLKSRILDLIKNINIGWIHWD